MIRSTTRQGGNRHIDTRAVLDYVDGLLATPAKRRVEEHLAGPCVSCRELLRDVGRVVALMRADVTPDVPEAIRARALDVFVPHPSVAPLRRSVWAAARLVFDSLTSPLPATTRRAIGESRRLRFDIGTHILDIELEPEGPGLLTLRGRLDLPDPALHRIDVSAAVERVSVYPDAEGIFVIERLPPGRMRISIDGPAGQYRVPPFRQAP